MLPAFEINAVQVPSMLSASYSSPVEPLKLRISRSAPQSRILLRLRARAPCESSEPNPSIARAFLQSLIERGPSSSLRIAAMNASRLTAQVVAMRTVKLWADSCTDEPWLKQCSGQITQSIFDFLRHYGGSASRWIYPWLYYSHHYLRQHPVEHMTPRELFHVLRVSALVTVKFWNDFEIGNREASKILDMPTKNLGASERSFLDALDFNLYIETDTLAAFKRSLRRLVKDR